MGKRTKVETHSILIVICLLMITQGIIASRNSRDNIAKFVTEVEGVETENYVEFRYLDKVDFVTTKWGHQGEFWTITKDNVTHVLYCQVLYSEEIRVRRIYYRTINQETQELSQEEFVGEINGSGPLFEPKVIMADQENIYVVWSDYFLLHYCMRNESNWSEIASVELPIIPRALTFAKGENNTLQIVCRAYGINQTLPNLFYFEYSVQENTNSEVLQITENMTAVETPQMVIDTKGEIHLVWEEDPEGLEEGRQLAYQTFEPGYQNSTEKEVIREIVAENFVRPILQIDAQDTLYLLWRNYYSWERLVMGYAVKEVNDWEVHTTEAEYRWINYLTMNQNSKGGMIIAWSAANHKGQMWYYRVEGNKTGLGKEILKIDMQEADISYFETIIRFTKTEIQLLYLEYDRDEDVDYLNYQIGREARFFEKTTTKLIMYMTMVGVVIIAITIPVIRVKRRR